MQTSQSLSQVNQTSIHSLIFCQTLNHRLLQNACVCSTYHMCILSFQYAHILTVHTHTRLTALFPGLPGWAGTKKVKPIWILLQQETVSGSGISWAGCKSAPRSRQITHASTSPLSFLQAGCPSCRPTNSVKALKAHFNCTYSIVRVGGVAQW